MRRLFLSAVCIAGLVACKKEATVIYPQEEGSLEQTAQRTSLVYSNGQNPYDSIGLLHNEGCGYLLNYGITKQNFSDQWIEANEDFAKSSNLGGYSYLPDFFESDSWKENFPYSNPFVTESADDVILQMYQNGSISSSESIYLQRLMSVADSFDIILTAQNYNVQSAYNQSYSSFVSIENEVMSANLGQESKKMLLSVASIGRYSLGYWINYLEDNNGGTLPQGKMKHYAKADMAGGAAASVGWGLWATFAGGAVGWGAAVVTGAVSTSVYEILMSL